MNKISSAPSELSHGIVGVHFGSSVLAFFVTSFISCSYSTVQEVKLKKELNIMSNILRWMVTTIGQKRILLKINHSKEDDSSCEMAVHGGNQWAPKKQKKKK